MQCILECVQITHIMYCIENWVTFNSVKAYVCIIHIRGHAQTTWTVRGGGGVGQMSTFVYVGGRGGWDHVYVVFFPYNFTQ